MVAHWLSRFSISKDNFKNSLPGIKKRNGIPLFVSSYITYRNKVGQKALNRCRILSSEQYPLDGLWKLHPDFPLAACFNVHNLCNERCIICPYESEKAGKPLQIMDLAKFRTVWTEFMAMGGRIATFNNFSDIFAHPAGMNYVRIALQNQNKVNTYFVTNGLALKKTYVDEIISSGWKGIFYVSCHGFSEKTFLKVTGINAFAKVVANAEYLASRHPAPERIIIQFATDFSNESEIKAARSFWNSLGCTLNSFVSHTFAGNSNHRGQPARTGRLAGCRGWGYDAGQPFFQAVIQPSGSLTLCCHDLQGKIVIGNVFDNGLAKVWKSEHMKNIIGLVYRGTEDKGTMEICRKCNLAQFLQQSSSDSELKGIHDNG